MNDNNCYLYNLVDSDTELIQGYNKKYALIWGAKKYSSKIMEV